MKKVSLFRYVEPFSAVGIGSVPFQEGKNSCKEIFKNWDIPFWPQYPGRSLRENFIFQFLSSFPGVRVGPQSASFEESTYWRYQKSFRRKLLTALRRGALSEFEPASLWALGYRQLRQLLERKDFPEKRVIKLQVTGPGTIWKFFFADRVSPNRARQIQKDLDLLLLVSGLAQVQRVLSCGRIPLIFVDEPVPGNLPLLRTLMSSLRKSKAFVGLHVCSFQDWKQLETLPMDLFHFDLTHRKGLSGSQCRFIQNFLKKGGGIAWGVIPTSGCCNDPARDFSSLVTNQLKKVLGARRESRGMIRHSLLAPACGTGTLSDAQDRKVWESLRLTAQGIETFLAGGK